MDRVRKILVPLSLDERDAALLSQLSQVIVWFGVEEVYFAHVASSFDPPASLDPALAAAVRPVDEEIESRLKQVVETTCGAWCVKVKSHYEARQGSIVPELLKLAVQKGVDLLCLRRRSAGAEIFASEQAVALLQKSHCPVLLIPPQAGESIRRVLVPIDFSESSKLAMSWTSALCRTAGDWHVTVQHVYEVPLGWHKSGHSYEEFASTIRRHAERDTRKLVEELFEKPVELRFDLRDGESIPNIVLRASQECQSQLIVLGARGRTASASLLLGHVSETIAARAHAMVLCVRQKGETVSFLKALLAIFE